MDLASLVSAALAEDIGSGDITTDACVDPGSTGTATITARGSLVVCGHAAAKETFAQVGAHYSAKVPDGAGVEPSAIIATIEGPLRGLLMGERVALNFLMRLS